MSERLASTLLTVVMVFDLSVLVAFIGLYWVRSRPRSPVGRNLLEFMAAVAVLGALSLRVKLAGPVSDWWWLAGFAILGVVGLARLLLLIRAQRQEP